MRLRGFFYSVFLFILFLHSTAAQSPDATVSGIITDPSGAAVAGADVVVVNDLTRVQYPGKSNAEGIYLVSNLPPGPYRLQVSKFGFKTIIKPDIILNVQDALAINFTLPLGAISETVTVQGGTPLVNTESAAVSTVVDRNFAENLPMNGRSFQTLIQLTPGVVLTNSTNQDAGQFSVNGQRAASNYWVVDGVSANVGISPGFTPSNGIGGALGSYSALGGTNSLVSVDAMQEFRIQTSTFAPEFGRTPGGQISIVTRSGTNQLHGTAFNYLRNDVFDANDWFANAKKLPKPEERQNDFGGTLGGAIRRDRTFFFFSYEGLRLRLPQVALDTVPDANSRQSATPAMQPFLNAFPLPNGPEVLDASGNPTGAAELNKSFSNPGTLDAYSLRIDERIGDKISVFGRYNYSPSQFSLRGNNGSSPLSTTFPLQITTQTATFGVAWGWSPQTLNDFRFNYSKTDADSHSTLDGFGGAVPLSGLPFPSPFTANNANLGLDILSLSGAFLSDGQGVRNVQHQFNIIDSISVQKGTHRFKFGIDYRNLRPTFNPSLYRQTVFFLDIPSAETGGLLLSQVSAANKATLSLKNFGAFAQDTWRVFPRLTLTYGLRWDLDFAPKSVDGPNLPAVTGVNLTDFSKLALAPAGTPPFETTYGNVAPRIGAAYQLSTNPNWLTVVRGGFGVFFDLATSETGNLISTFSYPFGANSLAFGGTFPLNSTTATPPPVSASSLSSGTLLAFNPKLDLPYTLEWNISLEQGIGTQQGITLTYVGAEGNRLIQTTNVLHPNPSFNNVELVGNTATSNYEALQVQYQRRLLHGLQALASYSWSHSIDTASAGSFANAANINVPGLVADANRGASDFDIRNAFSVGSTYDIPSPTAKRFGKAILGGWSVQNVIQARSAPPVNVFYSSLSVLLTSNTQVRPDVVAGQSFYLYGPQFPGGRALNPTAFVPPPTDPVTHLALRQGNLGRNTLRGFGATQWDFAIHRDFPIHESVKLQFRTELFNVLNHPNCGPPVENLGSPTSLNSQFGRATQMLAQSLGSTNVGGGGFDPLYQIGGPRSIQLALKILF